MSKKNKKIIIGCAQFGLPYGITNQSGRPKIHEISDILDSAIHGGINRLDLARRYGDAEKIIGSLHKNRFRITTKVAAEDIIAGSFNSSVKDSLEKLSISSLDSILVHDSHLLQGDFGGILLSSLMSFRELGFVSALGVSIYDPADLDLISDKIDQIDIVQCPFNVLDDRIISSGWGDRLKSKGKLIQARSVFLQGLLLCPVAEARTRYQPWANLIACVENNASQRDLSRLQLCLGYAISSGYIDNVVIGVLSKSQLTEVLLADIPESPRIYDFKIKVESKKLIDPRMW